MSARRLGLSYANLVSTLALIVAVTGGGVAYAATKAPKNSVVSRSIKNGTIKTKDLKVGAVTGSRIKDGSIELADLSVQARTALTPPPVDPWDPSKPLVSGTTITGSVYYQIAASSAGQSLRQSMAFPARASEPVTDASWAADLFGVTTDDDPNCLGSYGNPTAPPGMLCAYYGGSSNVTTTTIGNLAPGQDSGFVVRLTTAAAGPTMIDLTWAYSAP